MKKKTDPKGDAAKLRREAETRLSGSAAASGMPATQAEMQRLVHELRVHQIELEMQNEELVRERAEAEQILAKYIELYEHTPSGSFTLDREGYILELNLVGAKLLGKEVASAIGKSFQSFVSRDTRSAFSECFVAVFEKKSKESCEVRLEPEGGQPISVHIDGNSTPDGKACIMTAADITRRVKMEEAVRTAHSQFAAVLNTIPDIVWLKDREGRYIVVNGPFGQVCGVRPQDLVGQTDFDIWPKELAEKYRADDEEVMRTGRRKTVEESLVNKEGVRTVVETIKMPFRDGAGVTIGTVGIAHDITARIKIEHDLARRLGDVEKLNKFSVGREIKMMQLKERIKELEEKLGEK